MTETEIGIISFIIIDVIKINEFSKLKIEVLINLNLTNNIMKPRALSSTTLTGTNVENLQGDKIGSIKDLMIDLENGQVLYAVLSHGGFLYGR